MEWSWRSSSSIKVHMNIDEKALSAYRNSKASTKLDKDISLLRLYSLNAVGVNYVGKARGFIRVIDCLGG